MKKLIRTFAPLAFAVFLVLPAAAKEAANEPPKEAATNVLDFETDVIEGERKSPTLFLQLEIAVPNLDTLLYQRRNFNDFHGLERERRPKYRRITK